MLHHIRRVLQPINEDRDSIIEFNNHGTMYLILNAFASVAVVYLASTTSLNRWRALLKYDEIVTSPDTPLAFKFQSGVQTQRDKSWRNLAITLCSFLVMYTAFCGYVAFKQDFENGFGQYMGILLSIISTSGFSVIIRPRIVEGLFRIPTERGWAPFFLTMRISWTEAILIRAASVGLGIYTTIHPTPWLITAAMCGVTFRFISAPFISQKFVSVRGVALWFLVYMWTAAILGVLTILALDKFSSTDKNGSSGSRNAKPMGKSAVALCSSFLQFFACFPGILSALVLRAEWATAQAAAETRTRATFDIQYGKKQALLKKVDDTAAMEETIVPPKGPEPASIDLPESVVPSAPNQPKARAIRVPPVDPFHLSKDAKEAGRLEQFSSPVFHILLLSVFLCHVPTILLSTPTLNHYTTENVTWEFLHLFPGQFWPLLINPLVLVFVVLVRWSKGGKEIWRYGEKWSKDLPKKEETSSTAEITILAARVDVEGQGPLLRGDAA